MTSTDELLDGPWMLGISDTPDIAAVAFVDEIEPPMYPQLTLKDPPTGPTYYWYRRTVSIPDLPAQHRISVVFGAADWIADVWANEQHIATHRGGYLPFEATLPKELHGHTVTLTVRVWDSPLFVNGPVAMPTGEPTQSEWIPRGKQHWYGECSGLWQPIWLRIRPESRITGLRTALEADLQTVTFLVFGSAKCSGELRIRITEIDNTSTIWETSTHGHIDAGIGVSHLWPDVALWSPGSPSLYQVYLSFEADGITDNQVFTTGFRRVERTPHELRLNGSPLYLRGVLDQDYDPASGFAYAGDAVIAKRFAAARSAGLNLLRCHVKIPDPRYLAQADRIGMLVWYELPSWGHPHRPDGTMPTWLRGDVEAMIRESSIRDGHHPSLVARSIINEGWGLDLMNSSADRHQLREWVSLSRECDPSRLVIDNSALAGNTHVDTDLADFHTYASHPHGDKQFETAVHRLATRPPDLWARGDASAPQIRPVALTEFGIWGLPDNLPATKQGIEKKRRWSQSTAFDMEGFEERYSKSFAKRAFKNSSELRQATQQVQASGLSQQITTLRRTPGLSGFVLTELNDQSWEANGLLDFGGNEKPALASIRSVASETVVLIGGIPRSAWGGSNMSCSAILSGPRSTDTLDITWRINGELRRRETIRCEVGHTPTVIDTFEFQAPQSPTAEMIEVSVGVHSSRIDLEQRSEVLVIPQAAATIDGKLRVFLTGESAINQVSTLANALAEAGCTTLTEPTRVDAIVVAGGGSDAIDLVANGLPALVVADLADTVFLPSIPRLEQFDPHWCTGFDWMRTETFPDLAVGPLMQAPFHSCIAPRVIPALDGLDPADVLMGTYRGWLGNEAAITAQARYGKGRVVVTTLGLSSGGRSDPLARALLVRLLTYTTSSLCTPNSRIV